MKKRYHFLCVFPLLVLSLLAPAVRVAAQIPRKIPFQGVLKDGTGKPIDGTKTVTFTLYDASSTVVWSETKTVTAQRGVFNTLLGDITPFPTTLNFAYPFSVGIQVSGEAAEMTPRLPLASVPYALGASYLTLPYSSVTSADGTMFDVLNLSATGSPIVFSARVSAPSGLAFYGCNIASGSFGIVGAYPWAVYGKDGLAANGVGVSGQSDNGTGVYGWSTHGNGVYAYSADSNGLYATSLSEDAIRAVTNGDATKAAVRGEYTTSAGTLTRGSLGRVYSGVVGEDDRTDTAGSGVFGFATNGVGVTGSRGSNNAIGILATRSDIQSLPFAIATDIGSYGSTTYGIGVMGRATASNGIGVYARTEATSGEALSAESTAASGTAFGIRATAASSGTAAAFFQNSGGGNAIRAYGTGVARDQAVLRVLNTNAAGGMAAYITNNSTYATAHFANTGSGESLFIQSNTGASIRCVNNSEVTKFLVNPNGDVHAAGAFFPNGGDFAEMLPAASGLEPGDVLAISADGTLTKSSEAYQTSVAGVYSTQPGTVGVTEENQQKANKVPLAVVGVVPVKVSAENGSIHPGDLLTTSSTPGCAMKATDRSRILGAILGKALTPFSGTGDGTVSALVNLK